MTPFTRPNNLNYINIVQRKFEICNRYYYNYRDATIFCFDK